MSTNEKPAVNQTYKSFEEWCTRRYPGITMASVGRAAYFAHDLEAAFVAGVASQRRVVEAARALFGTIAPIEYDLGGNRLLIDLRAALADLEELK